MVLWAPCNVRIPAHAELLQELRGPRNDLKFHLRRSRPGGVGVILPAESDGDDEAARRARRRRFSG
eukprot:15464197-Alexandrium_andersonii.AAC.1